MRDLRRGFLGSSEVFLSLGSLDVASRIFAKDLPPLVMWEDFLKHSLLMLLYFPPLEYSGSERSCGTQPPLMQ